MRHACCSAPAHRLEVAEAGGHTSGPVFSLREDTPVHGSTASLQPHCLTTAAAAGLAGAGSGGGAAAATGTAEAHLLQQLTE